VAKLICESTFPDFDLKVSASSLAFDLRQEVEHRSGIVVEHLRASELPFAQPIEGEHGSVNSLPGRLTPL
jgi:hypothetical protein